MKPIELSALFERAEQALANRIKSYPELSKGEIEDVESVSRGLFPQGYRLSNEETERFRALCTFSQFELKPPIVRSHRRYLGPIIVFCKKIAWRILSSLLRDTFNSQRAFNCATVKQLARSESQNDESNLSSC